MAKTTKPSSEIMDLSGMVVMCDGLVNASKDILVNGTLGTAITSLTDNSGGTASNTIADVPTTYTEATLANQIASLTAKINAILAALRTAGVIAS